MTPDYSGWKITLEDLVRDFEREKLEGGKGADIASGFTRWVQYDDGHWYYLTEGGEQFRAIARAFLCDGCDQELYDAQPQAFRKYVWASDLFPYSTMPANVPVLMPQKAVDKRPTKVVKLPKLRPSGEPADRPTLDPSKDATAPTKVSGAAVATAAVVTVAAGAGAGLLVVKVIALLFGH